jgi:polar amino acid transport system substrate-binding protein
MGARVRLRITTTATISASATSEVTIMQAMALRSVSRSLAAGLLALAAWMPLVSSAQDAPRAPDARPVEPQNLPARAQSADVAPVMQTLGLDTLATIRKRGKLRVGVITVDPMVMRNTGGELVGYSIDVMRRLAEDMGIGVEFVQSSALFMIPELLDSRFDLIATGLWVTTQRALIINFSDPTAVEGVYLVASKAKAGKKVLLSDYDQPGVKIAVFSNTVQEKLAHKMFPRATVVRVDGSEVSLVASGEAHAALVPTLAPRALLQRAPDKLFLPREQPLSHTPAALGVRKGDPDFLNFLNTWLSLRRGEGWLDERAHYWSTPAAPQK